MPFNNRVEKAEDLARKIHGGYESGQESPVFIGLRDAAEQIYKYSESPRKKEVYIATLLHKSDEEGLLATGQKPLPLSYIERFFGGKVGELVSELRSRPASADKLSLWATSLSPEAGEIVMADEIAALKKNGGDPARAVVIEALKNTNPLMYNEYMTYGKGLEDEGAALQKRQEKEAAKLARVASMVKNFFVKK